MDTFTNTNSINTLTEAEKLLCDRPIKIKECEEILLTFSNNKSPGKDGLTFEFYRKFWNSIKIPLMECFEYAFEHNELSTSQKQGVITLLEKQGKNRKHLENWRPISLLNFDYKLLTKLLSNRIKEFLPQLNPSKPSWFYKRKVYWRCNKNHSRLDRIHQLKRYTRLTAFY